MNSLKVNCGNIEISNNNRICIIAGPCQLETEQHALDMAGKIKQITDCLLYTSPSPRDATLSRMPSSA